VIFGADHFRPFSKIDGQVETLSRQPQESGRTLNRHGAKVADVQFTVVELEGRRGWSNVD
jgi:hypothetical protein